MKSRKTMLVVALGVSLPLTAQTQNQPPQTARQALIEMFLGNESDALAKHLPDAARNLMAHNQNGQYAPSVLHFANFGRQMALGGEEVETFDEGPKILISHQGEDDRMEVAVERDSMAGETEEIELSVHLYHGGQEKWLSIIPRILFALKQEKNVWQLIEVTASERLPLSDPEYLRGLRQQQQEANESSAQMRVGIIVAAETSYATWRPERGYICALPTLFAQGETDPASNDSSEGPPFYYDPGQWNTEWSGYRFTLAGCDGIPALKYQLLAVPIDSDAGAKTFCADESGTVKSLIGGKVSACFSSGEVLRSANDPGFEVNQ